MAMMVQWAAISVGDGTRGVEEAYSCACCGRFDPAPFHEASEALCRYKHTGDNEFFAQFIGLIEANCIRRAEIQCRFLELPPEDALDCFQEGTISVLTHISDLVCNKNVEYWLSTIIENKLLDRARRKNRFLVDDLSSSQNGDAEDSRTSRLSGVANDEPTSIIQIKEDLMVLDEAISRLPDNERMVIALLQEGNTYKRIANRLGIPIGTVGSLIRRARERLRGWLKDHFPQLASYGDNKS